MSRSLLLPILLLLPAFSLAQSNPSTGVESPINDGFFSHAIPEDIAQSPATKRQQDWIERRQKRVDRHAWLTFGALMWPVQTGQRGVANEKSHVHSPDVQRVWETWLEQSEVYDPGVRKPDWQAIQSIPDACPQPGKKFSIPTRHLYRTEKVHDTLDAVLQAVQADATLPATLKDRHGKTVRYEIRLNRKAVDYIVANKLYDGNIQAQKDNINLPDGSIVVKAAWREFSKDASVEERSKFMTRQACVCDDFKDNCHQAEMGLVGFHIMRKTRNAPQWLWFTFEHNANVHSIEGMPASFKNPSCPNDDNPYCIPNSQTPNSIPNHVTQILEASAGVRRLNQGVQDFFRRHESVLQYYQLMSAQWPEQVAQSATHPTVFNAHPQLSTNTTMETFAQETSSCIGCHAMSRTMNPDKFVSADFSFTLNNAYPKPEGAVCAVYGESHSIMCSEDIILFHRDNPVMRGYSLVTDTYKQLPDNVGNKLHCGTCHLHAGGDPNAAWWVNMSKLYPQDGSGVMQDGSEEAMNLAERINQCFERSMSGKKLCDGAACDADPNMSAIIAYMDWLTETYHQKNPCDLLEDPNACNTPRSFPPLTTDINQLTGDPVRGEKLYTQKCAFCHNDQGQGRYENDTYFRPALWGDDSYNVSASMATLEKFAPFVRWNMPYGSGGMLTDQEAMDLGCYVNQHKRPGKDEEGVIQSNKRYCSE